MIYLSSFLFSEETVSNPNIYPYNVFAGKNEKVLVFNSPVTVLYGNNASGKSTMLNIMANRLGIEGQEVSLSPANQTVLVEKLNQMARFLGCQFIISTHSSFMLGTLHARIYNLDSGELVEAKWTELENVRYFYDFFERHRGEFLK